MLCCGCCYRMLPYDYEKNNIILYFRKRLSKFPNAKAGKMEYEVKQEEGRFYAVTEHGEAELLYRIDGNVMEAFHTFTPPEDRGKGIAERLAMAALDFAKSHSLKIKPECTYMQFFFYKHPEFKDYEEEL